MLVAGCASRRSETVQIGQGMFTPDEIQAAVMSFADTYSSLISQGFDDLQLADDTLSTRRFAVRGKIEFVGNAFEVAASQNPLTALLDMTVMVTLQRMVWEEHWRPNQFPDDNGESLSARLAAAERDIWELVATVLTQEEQDTLRLLIQDMRERFSDQVYVSSLRASEFAKSRRAQALRSSGGGSLFALFGLDPVASLHPTTQQIAASRLLGERAFFYATRAPTLMNWQLEDVLLDTVAEPEIQRVIQSSQDASEAAGRAVAVAEDLAERLTPEREAAIEQLSRNLSTERDATINQLSEELTAEREAAIEQFFDLLAQERAAIIQTIEDENARINETMSQLRGIVDSSRELSDSVGAALTEAGRITDEQRRNANPDARPFDVTEYEALVDSLTEGVRELQVALESTDQILSTLASDEKSAMLRTVVDEGTTGANQVIDRAFWRLLILIGALLAGLLITQIIVRLVGARVSPAGSKQA